MATLALIAGLPALSINEARGRHWASIREVTEQWAEATFYGARQAINRGTWPRTLGPGSVLVTIPFPTLRRRDPHNYTSTIVKAVVDGLVNSGLWPDDTAEWVTVLDPILETGHYLWPTVVIAQRREEAVVLGQTR